MSLFNKDADPIKNEKALMVNTLEVLDEEKENILSEVLRCYVCLELPKGKQVKICEEGHHCCFTCHKKIKVCGICRGRLLEARNFVVEQLVNKFGLILGAQKNEPPSQPPRDLPPGSFPCLHHCSVTVPAFQMLPHLRAKHSSTFLENVCSNPYSNHFSFRLNTVFSHDHRYVWSVWVSDMGLFTMELTFEDLDLYGSVRMLATEEVASLFRYQLVIKMQKEDSECLTEFGVTSCPVWSYLADAKEMRKRGNCLKMKGEHLLDHVNLGSALGVFISIWEKKANEEVKGKPGLTLACVPETHTHFEIERKKRKNKSRNSRRRRVLLNEMEDFVQTLDLPYFEICLSSG